MLKHVIFQTEDLEKRQEEQRKWGIFYDDDYNYMQHIKSSDDREVELQPVERVRIPAAPLKASKSSNLNLPSNVFASEKEEEVGLLNKAAPMGLRLDWDPEVLAAMDEDFDFEDPDNQLEDDFVELANAEGYFDFTFKYSIIRSIFSVARMRSTRLMKIGRMKVTSALTTWLIRTWRMAACPV
jgi:hypothetical protein